MCISYWSPPPVSSTDFSSLAEIVHSNSPMLRERIFLYLPYLGFAQTNDTLKQKQIRKARASDWQKYANQRIPKMRALSELPLPYFSGGGGGGGSGCGGESVAFTLKQTYCMAICFASFSEKRVETIKRNHLALTEEIEPLTRSTRIFLYASFPLGKA